LAAAVMASAKVGERSDMSAKKVEMTVRGDIFTHAEADATGEVIDGCQQQFQGLEWIEKSGDVEQRERGNIFA